MRRRLRRALTGAATMLALGVLAAPSAVADNDVIFEVTDERVQTASGLAADRDRQMYWTVNSGPDADRAFALRTDGSVEGTVRFGQTMVDPQGVYYIGSRLYIADIGDADGTRDSIAVYRYTDPAPMGQQPETIRVFRMHYADGQARDARAMLVGDDGRLFVITHEADAGIWATNGQPSSGEDSELVRVGDAPAWVTDAVFLSDGRIATRSYTSIEILDASTYQVAARAPAPYQDQGEGIALSLDRQSLILASSGVGQPVLDVAIPDDLLTVPEPGPTPPPSPEPTPTATPEPDEEVEEAPAADDRAGGERTGTLVALLAAGGLALASFLVVLFAGTGRGRQPRPLTSGRAIEAARSGGPLSDPAGDGDAEAEDTDDVWPHRRREESPTPAVKPAFAEHLDFSRAVIDENPFGTPYDPDPDVPLITPPPPPAVAAAPPVVPPPVAAPPPVVAPPPKARRALPELVESDAHPRHGFTISENDPDVPVRPRPKRSSIVEPDFAFDDEGTWVRPERGDAQGADDLKWLYRR